MDKNRLRSLLFLYGDNQRKLAKFLGIKEQTVSVKINERNGAEFNKSEIDLMKERYNLTSNDIDMIFFSKS